MLNKTKTEAIAVRNPDLAAVGARGAWQTAVNMQIIRSRRRTVGLETRADGLIVRAPLHMTQAQIEAVLRKHQRWIETHLKQAAERETAPAEPLTREELQRLMERAKLVFPERVRHFAPLVGVEHGRITIRCQKTRWGSCSAKGNLNFNCLLLLAPPEVLDSVVAHELCHRKYPNHSARFYEEVLHVFPDYRKWDKWLKENGASLLQRSAGKR